MDNIVITEKVDIKLVNKKKMFVITLISKKEFLYHTNLINLKVNYISQLTIILKK